MMNIVLGTRVRTLVTTRTTMTTMMKWNNSILLLSFHYPRRHIMLGTAVATTKPKRTMMTSATTLPRTISLLPRTTSKTTMERTSIMRSSSSSSSLSLQNNNHNSRNSGMKIWESNNYNTTSILHSSEYISTAATTTNTNCNSRRSIVTITQTKVSDDVSSLSPSSSSPLFINDDNTNDVNTNDAGVSLSSSALSSLNDNDNKYVFNPDTTLIVTGSCLNRVETLLKQRHDDDGDCSNRDDDSGSNNSNYFLRVYVDAGGCSGFQYQFELDNELDEENSNNNGDAAADDDEGEDVIIVSTKVTKNTTTTTNDDNDEVQQLLPRIVIDKTSLGFLEGSTIDYVVEMIKSAFVVTDNPLSESACGCGSSFALKNFGKNSAKH